MLYVNFAMVHYPTAEDGTELMSAAVAYGVEGGMIDSLLRRPTLSYQRLQTVQPLSDVELYDKIRRTVSNKHELQVLESFLVFNKYAFYLHEVLTPESLNYPQARSEDQLLPTDQSCSFLPYGT